MARGKKICVVCDGYWDQLQGGAEYQLYIISNALIKNGMDVHYVYVNRGTNINPTTFKLHPINIDKRVARIFYPYQYLLYFKLKRVLKEINPEFIINRVGNALTGLCAYYCRKNGIKMIWQIASVNDLLSLNLKLDRTLISRLIDNRILEYGIRNSTYIFAQAEYQGVQLKKKFNREPDMIFPNIHPEAMPRLRDNNTKKVVWIANIKPNKNPEIFVELAKEIRNLNNVDFIMVGREESPRYQKRIMQLVNEAGNVQYPGELPIEEVNKILDTASVFVNTSTYEGFPNTFIQAWMRGVPVVSLYFDPDDVIKSKGLGYHSRAFHRMVADVNNLIVNDELRHRLGNAAREYAIRYHGIEKNMKTLVQFLEAH